MKIQLEKIQKDKMSSFHLLHDPKLNDLFFWHFHPEYELVYIEGADGIRYVGKHSSNFYKSDLVLIGSNIPHLNFDYGIKTEYRKEVIQISPIFRKQIFEKVHEFLSINSLFEKSQYGISFHGETKKIIGEKMKKLHLLNSFEQFIAILNILNTLSKSEEFEFLHKNPVYIISDKKNQERLEKIYRYIDKNYDRKIKIKEVADLVNLGKEAFCRYFKKHHKKTFTSFLNQYRISHAKRLLLSGKNVTEACYGSGFDSLSYFNRTFKKFSGKNPSSFKHSFTMNS